MGFDVAAESYHRFMGRWSEPLAERFLDGLDPDPPVLDVGAGPGALTSLLVRRLGAGEVHAVDPSPPFVAALRERLPGVEVRAGGAEDLPFADDTYGAALAQLVVHFMRDPVAGMREMARVTRPGGVLAACVWDQTGTGPLSPFWRAVQDLDPTNPGESELPGTREGHLVELAHAAGWRDVRGSVLVVSRDFATFEDWWEPYLLGVGPPGDHVAGLDDEAREVLRERCRVLLPEPPFRLEGAAWSVAARA